MISFMQLSPRPFNESFCFVLQDEAVQRASRQSLARHCQNWRVPLDFEPFLPSGLSRPRAVDIMLTSIRATSWNSYTLPSNDEYTGMFSCYRWLQLRLVSQWFHWEAAPCAALTHWGMDCTTDSAVFDVWTTATVCCYRMFVQNVWHICCIDCLMTMCFKFRELRIKEGNCATWYPKQRMGVRKTMGQYCVSWLA